MFTYFLEVKNNSFRVLPRFTSILISVLRRDKYVEWLPRDDIYSIEKPQSVRSTKAQQDNIFMVIQLPRYSEQIFLKLCLKKNYLSFVEKIVFQTCSYGFNSTAWPLN